MCVCVCVVLVLTCCRILGTPTNLTWPGVADLPDYKPNFPHWTPKDLNVVVSGLGKEGCDLLAVSFEIQLLLLLLVPLKLKGYDKSFFLI